MSIQLPELIRKRAEKLLEDYCLKRSARLEVRLTWEEDGQGFLLVEKYLEDEQEVRQEIVSFRYQPELCQWSLHLPHAGRWRFCSNIQPNLDLAKLLDFVDIDPFKQFWR